MRGFPHSSVGKEFACNAGDPGLIPGSGRSAGEGIGYPLQYSWASLVAQLVESTWNVGNLVLTPGLGRSSGEGKGYPLQYSGLENSMDCIVHGVTKSWTRLSNFHFHFQKMKGETHTLLRKRISSVQLLSRVSLQPHELQHSRPPCPSPTPGVNTNSCPSSRWCHPDVSSSVVPFSSCRQSLPASGPFPMSQLFTWGGQSIGVSASASVLPMNTQDWSPLAWTGWNSLQSKGLSRAFSNTTVQKEENTGL